MKTLFETLQQVSLGLFVNGSYDLLHGDYDIRNFLIVLFTVSGMYIFNHLKGIKWKEKH